MEYINNKKEIKFILNPCIYKEIKQWILQVGCLDNNCKSNGYRIVSGYILKWKNNNSINEKESSKLRIRRYVNDASYKIYLEEKRKKNNLVKKRRIEIDEEVSKQYFMVKRIEDIKELNTKFNFNLEEEVYEYGKLVHRYISYFREPYYLQYNHNNFRVTIDSKFYSFSNYDEFFHDSSFYDEKSMENEESENIFILEVKGENLESIILKMRNEYDLEPVKISKMKLCKKIQKKQIEVFDLVVN